MNLLPIGSVVLLKEADKRLMIYGVKQVNNEDGTIYDYIGCLYPEGNIDAEYNFLFQHKDIEKVEFVGYMDAEFQVFRQALKKQLETEQAEETFN